jgi:hypothetical protein
MSAHEHLSTEQFGMVVHPADEWPVHNLSARPRSTGRIAPDTPVHTTQEHVHAGVLESTNEGRGPVSVALQRVDGGQRIWLVDGHHRLATARARGEHVEAEVHGPGADPVNPPTYSNRR